MSRMSVMRSPQPTVNSRPLHDATHDWRSPVRVLILTPGVFDKGGISRYVRYQARALAESPRISEVETFSLSGRRIDDFEEPFDAAWAGPTSLDAAARMLFVWEVMRAAHRFRPDVVVSAHINLGPLTALVCAAVKARHVQNIYGREVWSGLGFLRREACRRANAVLSDCENTLDRALELNLVKAESHVVHDCVDLERFTSGPPDPAVLAHYGLARELGRFRILLLGRLNATQRYKGTERAIHLLEGLPEDFEVVLAGRGDDISYLRAQAVRLGVGDRVLFPGSLEEAHLNDVYRSADAFFLVSSVGHAQGEGLPLTPIEAMACGVPAMVGTEDGSREIISSSGGTTVSPSDLCAPRAYVLRLKAEPDFAAAESVAARDRVVEEFDFPTFSARTLTAVTGSSGNGAASSSPPSFASPHLPPGADRSKTESTKGTRQ